MSQPAKLVIQNIGDVTIVSLEEARLLDAFQIEQMGKELYRLVDDMDRKKLVLDFTKVQFLASTAVGVMVNLRNKSVAAKGQLIICGMKPQLKKVFEIMNLTKIFTFCADEKAAMKTLGFPV
jgi:anti-sigma B factor antagonist